MNRRSFFRGLLQAACVAVASKVLPSSLVKASWLDEGTTYYVVSVSSNSFRLVVR